MEHNHVDFFILQDAFIGIVLMSIIVGIVGSILVSNKIVFVGGAIAHSSYGGIGMALFYGFSTLLGAGLSAVIVALILSFIKYKMQKYTDVIMAITWALGMSIGAIFIDLKGESEHIDIENYLFGSLLSINSNLMMYMGIFCVILLLFCVIYYREILSISYDIDFCRLKRINIHVFTTILFVLISLGIILSMQISGLILVLAMMSIPAYCANIFAKNMKYQIFYASILSFIFMCAGLGIAIKFHINVGASITLFSIFIAIIVYILKALRRYK